MYVTPNGYGFCGVFLNVDHDDATESPWKYNWLSPFGGKDDTRWASVSSA